MTNNILKFEVNKRVMEFMKGPRGEYELPLLVSTDKLGRKASWRTFVLEDKIYSESWVGDNGKVKKYEPSTVEPKNIGRANETTSFEQALFECYSRWTKKQDKDYRPVEDKEDTDITNVSGQVPNVSGQVPNVSGQGLFLPMLANKYEERKKYITMPCAGSRKLDGVRALARLNEEGEVLLTTRTGKEIHNLSLIKAQIKDVLEGNKNIILDGELYSHNIPFNMISGCTRSKAQSEYDDKLEYYMFDIADSSLTYKERVERLRELKSLYKTRTARGGRLAFEFYDVINSERDIKPLHDKFVAEGYEGLILRNFHGKYLFKNRSNDLLKYKDFIDEEFEIVGYKDGNAADKDCIIFRCKTKKGEEFDVRPRGSVEYKKQLFKNGDKLLGKMLTVRYQNTGLDQDSCLPRFPVGIDIRDYE